MAQQIGPAKPTTDLKSSQGSLLISEIKDGVVVMRDGSMRAVILSSAINFDLMSQQEQDGVEYSYQSFLNSLHFPVQIVIKSQKIDLDSYIEDLTKRQADMDNQLLAALMTDYISNIKGLIEEVNIMDKQFFVVVPHYPHVNPSGGNVVTGVMNTFKPSPVVNMSAADFESSKTELGQRVQLVSSGLSQMGLRAIPLNTQELIDLYYASYNPDVAANQKLIDASQFQTASVTRGNPDVTPRAFVPPPANTVVAPGAVDANQPGVVPTSTLPTPGANANLQANSPGQPTDPRIPRGPQPGPRV